MKYALLRNQDGTPYQLVNGLPGMDWENFYELVLIEVGVCPAVGADVISEDEYNEIIAFNLADIQRVQEL